MKRYIRSETLTDNHPNTTLAEAFIEECTPYNFMLYKEYDDSYELVGVPGFMESIPELIRLVESICKHYGIEFFDAHVGQGDQGDFIIFKIRK